MSSEVMTRLSHCVDNAKVDSNTVISNSVAIWQNVPEFQRFQAKSDG